MRKPKPRWRGLPAAGGDDVERRDRPGRTFPERAQALDAPGPSEKVMSQERSRSSIVPPGGRLDSQAGVGRYALEDLEWVVAKPASNRPSVSMGHAEISFVTSTSWKGTHRDVLLLVERISAMLVIGSWPMGRSGGRGKGVVFELRSADVGRRLRGGRGCLQSRRSDHDEVGAAGLRDQGAHDRIGAQTL